MSANDHGAQAQVTVSDPIAAWLAADTGDQVTGRPWQVDLDHPCRALAELAQLCDLVADELGEETHALTIGLHDVQQLASAAAADLERGAATNRAHLAVRATDQHASLARHEILRNLLTQLYAAWRNVSHNAAATCQAPSSGGRSAAT